MLFLLPGWHIFLGRKWVACALLSAPPFHTSLNIRAIPLKWKQNQVILMFPTFNASHCPILILLLKGTLCPLHQSCVPLVPAACLSFRPSAQLTCFPLGSP